jgi:rSAM/selenodomain-associated transferase 1
MARHPEPGRVKTRLAATLGDATACALYEAMLLDLADRLAVLRWPVTWAYTPAAAPFARLLPGARCRPQADGDLGDRMRVAVAEAFAAGPGPVLVLGADVPHVPAAALAAAADALASDADVALGPAADGGYYLVGLARPAPALFAGIPWGTGTVLDATVARARALGLRTRLLPPGFDVDEPADLRRLGAALARGEARLPRTRRLLAGLADGS